MSDHPSSGVSCVFPGNPVKGYTSPTRSFYEIGEEVQFDCEEGYTLVGSQTSECTENGSFDEKLPSCISKKQISNHYFNSIAIVVASYLYIIFAGSFYKSILMND